MRHRGLDREDLRDNCRYYLAHPDERSRIINNAASALDKISGVDSYAQVLESVDEAANASRAGDV